MKCPVCPSANLVMSERQGIEIDYCPECRGVWLDRGELDKIIERAAPREVAAAAPPQQPQPQQPQPNYGGGPAQGYNQGYGHGHGHGHGHGQKPYRKKSFLEELFD
jgi:Zn-finger nucleic acid-binding protein